MGNQKQLKNHWWIKGLAKLPTISQILELSNYGDIKMDHFASATLPYNFKEL